MHGSKYYRNGVFTNLNCRSKLRYVVLPSSERNQRIRVYDNKCIVLSTFLIHLIGMFFFFFFGSKNKIVHIKFFSFFFKVLEMELEWPKIERL